MGEMVNRIFEVAARWQRDVVWIRMNVCYMKAELAYLSKRSQDVSDLRRLLESFDLSFEQFCQHESAVFVISRLLETEEARRSGLSWEVRARRSARDPESRREENEASLTARISEHFPEEYRELVRIYLKALAGER